MQEPRAGAQSIQAEPADTIWSIFSQAFAPKQAVRTRKDPLTARCKRKGKEKPEKKDLQLSCKCCSLRKSVEACGLPQEEDLTFAKGDGQ